MDLKTAYTQINEQLSQVIVGQQDVVDQLLISIFCKAHCILEGVPGLAKTLLISTLSRAMDLTFSRIQFTPDLMPADITGTDVMQEDKQTGRRSFQFIEGPLFANIVLADEINRTPPKTQAALLEAMQERQTTVGRTRHTLPNPFFVLATQNPIEQEGTYPLPEAQQDRFMFKILVDYPHFDEELEIAKRTTAGALPEVKPVITAEDIIKLQESVLQTPIADSIVRYCLALVRQTRIGQDGVPDFVNQNVSWGAGPRAVQYLILAAKAKALLRGASCVAIEDVQAIAKPVLRHRILMNFTAQSEGVTSDDLTDKLLAVTPVSDDELLNDPRMKKIFK
ncbi:MAG: MoxR family ATPase [Thermoguttaceae bacterium]|nr:MoxR family ATPase [Thermoguttaceae bacterium]